MSDEADDSNAPYVIANIPLIGPGAGRRETGYAILSDLLELRRRT